MPAPTTPAKSERDPTQVTGIILAGGAGQRMGGIDKGWVRFRDEALVQHVIDRFAPQVHRIVISCNRNLEQYQQLGHQIVRDAQSDYQGPLAGICAALSCVETEWAAIVPVDAPFLALDLVDSLLRCAHAQHSDACCAVNDGALEPTFCVIRSHTITALQDYMARTQDRSVQGFLKSIGCAYCEFSDATAFKNLNRPEDLM